MSAVARSGSTAPLVSAGTGECGQILELNSMGWLRDHSWVLVVVAAVAFFMLPPYRLSVVAAVGLLGSINAVIEGRLPVGGKRSVTYVYTGREARVFAGVLALLFFFLLVVSWP
jgi:hypothetical protein